MTRLQRRIERIAAIAQEYLAARSASELLTAALEADPSHGEGRGWRFTHARQFVEDLDATYIIKMYAEFEATLRDYWKTHRRRDTHPPMKQLVNESIPVQLFPQDRIDNADDVRVFRNFLVHEPEDEPPSTMRTFTVAETKKHLCAYAGCLDARWR